MARPKKEKAPPKKPDPAPDVVDHMHQDVLDAPDLSEAIAMMRAQAQPAPPHQEEPEQMVPQGPPPMREGETMLNDEQKAYLNATLLGQPEVITHQTGFGNQPPITVPQSVPTQYDFRPVELPPNPPSRPRTPSQPRPEVYKTTADDATLMEVAVLRTKIEAYMRIKPELARQVAMPVRGSSAEDHRMALAQCRTMLSCGNEEVWLQWGLEYGAQFLEGMLPFVRERVPDAVAVQLNGEGVSDDVRKALSGESDALADIQLRTAMQLCAVDLIGLISVSPWAMLGMGMLQAFTRKVKKNNDMLRSQYMAQAARDGVRMNSEYDNL